MDNAYAEELKELYRQQEHKTFIPKLLAHLEREKKCLEEKCKKCDRICEQQVAGCDWISFSNQKVTLRADVAYVAPFNDWELYNCVIRIEDIKPRYMELTIIPNTFPIWGEDELEGATWKAVVWLEPKKGYVNEPEREVIMRRIEQLELCQKNLSRNY